MWLILAFVSATFLGFYDTSKKASLRENAVLPVLFLNTVFSTLIFLPFLLDYLGGLGWFSGTFLDTAPLSSTVHDTAPLSSKTQITDTQAVVELACRPGDAGLSCNSIVSSDLHYTDSILHAHLLVVLKAFIVLS
jgi:hypothetical protein